MTGTEASRGSARRLVAGGGVRLDGKVADDPAVPVSSLLRPSAGAALLRRGKRTHHLLLLP